MAKIALHEGVWASSAGFVLTGISGVVVTEPGSLIWWLAWASFAVGAGLLVWGVKIRGKPWWRLWKRPILYVSHVRERLPAEGPDSPFFLYSILDAYPPDTMFWGTSEHSGAIPWGRPTRPWAQRVEVTNHSDDTLVNVVVNVAVEPVPVPGRPPVSGAVIDVQFDQVRPGQTSTAFIVNDSPVMGMGRPIAATGTPIGGKPTKLRFHAKTYTSGMMLPPADRFLTDASPPSPTVIETLIADRERVDGRLKKMQPEWVEQALESYGKSVEDAVRQSQNDEREGGFATTAISQRLWTLQIALRELEKGTGIKAPELAEPKPIVAMRQCLDLSHNEGYIKEHRENVAKVRQLLKDLAEEKAKAERELGELQNRISAEVRRIGSE
jgi:hypothetical protein